MCFCVHPSSSESQALKGSFCRLHFQNPPNLSDFLWSDFLWLYEWTHPAPIMPLLPQDLDENERWEDERAMSKWFVACVYSSEMIPQALGFPMLFARIERMTQASISTFGMSCSFVMCIWCVYIYIYIWVRVAHVYMCNPDIRVYIHIGMLPLPMTVANGGLCRSPIEN